MFLLVLCIFGRAATCVAAADDAPPIGGWKGSPISANVSHRFVVYPAGPSGRAITFIQDEAGKWNGPWADLRNLGADTRQQKWRHSFDDVLFPLGSRSSTQRDLRRADTDEQARELSIIRDVTGAIARFFAMIIDFVFFEFLRDPPCTRSCVGWCSCDGFSCERKETFSLMGQCMEDDDSLSPLRCDRKVAPAPYKCPPCMKQGQFKASVSGYCDGFMTCGVPITTGECADATQQCHQWSDHGVEEDGRVCPLGGSANYYCSTYLAENAGSCNRRELRGEEEALYNSTINVPTNRSVVAFVRIPKTGSTTALKFLQRAKKMHTWDKYVDILVPALGESDGSSNIAGCIHYAADQTPQLSKGRSFWNRCPHVPLGKIVEFWGQSLSNMESNSTTVTYKDDINQSTHVGSSVSIESKPRTTLSFESFTIVRDPFDRLVSYFYYLRKYTNSSEFLSHTCTTAQYDAVKENDLSLYIELLHTEGGGMGLELPWQYKFIHEDADEAIRLIQHEASPGVFALLTECYEASLRLLTEAMCCFPEGSVDALVASEEFKSNTNTNPKGKADARTLRSLRAKAELWFADDFRFYNAVVEQFQRKMDASSLDPSVFDTCSIRNRPQGQALPV